MINNLKKMSKVKTQHYVPRFYLKNFMDSNERIWVYDKKNKSTFNPSILNIACENFFYDNDTVDLAFDEEQYLEKYYSSKEAEFAPLLLEFITKLESGEINVITSNDRDNFANYLVLQIDRTKEHREESIQSYQVIIKQLRVKGFTEDQIKEFGFDEEEISPKGLHIESILTGFKMDKTFIDILKNHIWLVFKNETSQPFYTSDNPIVKKAHIIDKFFSYEGYASLGIEIVFPISPKFILVLCEREYFKESENLENMKISLSDINFINYYNSLQVVKSYRQVYATTNSFEIVKDLLLKMPNSFDIDRKRVE